MELINKRDAPLVIDVVCAKCDRRMALSNAYQYNNQFLCPLYS